MNDNDPTIKFNPRRDQQSQYDKQVAAQKPTGAPTKPFKNLMDMDSGGEGSELGERQLLKRKDIFDEIDDATMLEQEEQTIVQQQGPTSIFDMNRKALMKDPTLTSADTTSKTATTQQPKSDSSPTLSPALLFRSISKHEVMPGDVTANENANLEGKLGPTNKKGELGAENVSSQPIVKDQPPMAAFTQGQQTSKQEKFSQQFSKEQPDISAVNPLIAQQPTPVERTFQADIQRPVTSPQTVQDLVNQMVKEIQMQEMEGQTNTTVRLTQPPMFEGAQLVLTSFDTAKGQFNISFQNLGPEAKTLMDMQSTQDSLKHTLETKGYMVHIVIATTAIENPIIPTDPGNARGTREERRDEQRGHPDEENETG